MVTMPRTDRLLSQVGDNAAPTARSQAGTASQYVFPPGSTVNTMARSWTAPAPRRKPRLHRLAPAQEERPAEGPADERQVKRHSRERGPLRAARPGDGGEPFRRGRHHPGGEDEEAPEEERRGG